MTLPYIPHYYTEECPWPHTYARYENLFSIRRAQGSIPSTVRVTREKVVDILNIHRVQDTGLVARNNQADFYSLYDRFGMTRAQHYLETRIDRFFRILFFLQELEAAILENNREDDYDGPIPHEFITNNIQDMLHDDNLYGDYLAINSKIHTRDGDRNNPNIQSLEITIRVQEEDLILVNEYLISALRTRLEMSNLWNEVAGNTTSTTEASVTSTTPRSQERKSKKGSVCINEKGKSFMKQPERTGNCCDNTGSNGGKNLNGRSTTLCLMKVYNYVVKNPAKNVFDACKTILKQLQTTVTNNNYNIGNLNRLNFPKDESSIFIKILSAELSTVGGESYILRDELR